MLRVIRLILSLTLLTAPSSAYAGEALDALRLPLPGVMVGISGNLTPPLLNGIVVDLNDPLALRFVVDPGKNKRSTEELSAMTEQQVKYFLTALTVPSKDLWVNLSPYEKERMIPAALGGTDLGRDMLAQDYILKQFAASMIHPDSAVGKAFWTQVYAQAQARFGTTDIPVDTFNKLWIIPDTAVVFEQGARGYVTKATLKVLLDEDYLALEKGRSRDAAPVKNPKDDGLARTMTTRIMREIVIPAITQEVNEGANFAPLRQIYHALILAKWYKQTVRNQLFEQVYFGRNQLAGLDLKDPGVGAGIYARYVEAFKTGVVNTVNEETDPVTGLVTPHKYFSGGENFDFSQLPLATTSDPAGLNEATDPRTVDVRLDPASSQWSQRLLQLIKSFESRGDFTRAESGAIFSLLNEKGFTAFEATARHMGNESLLHTLSILDEYDPIAHARFDQYYSEPETPIALQVQEAKYIIANLSNAGVAHQMSHLAHANSWLEHILPDYSTPLTAAGRAELRRLQLLSKKLEKDNQGLRALLSGLEHYKKPSAGFTVFLYKKIVAHLGEAQRLQDQLMSFLDSYMSSIPNFHGTRASIDNTRVYLETFEEELQHFAADSISQTAHFKEFLAAVQESLQRLNKVYKHAHRSVEINLFPCAVPKKMFIVSSYVIYDILEILVDNARSAGATVFNVVVDYSDERVALTVQDNGPVMNGPMPAEVAARINAGVTFTSKNDIRQTGILGSGEGLAFIRQHSSSVVVTAGEKTTKFTIVFQRSAPAHVLSVTTATPPSDAGMAPTSSAYGGIDVTELNVDRSGQRIVVTMDPLKFTAFSTTPFKGFRPVIVSMAPASSALAALGL